MTGSFDRRLAESTQVGHAMNMIAELPPYTQTDKLPIVVQVAGLESCYSNVRLLVEFVLLPSQEGRIHRHDFLPGWNPPASRTLTRLKAEYGFASEHVSHLMRKRVPTTGDIIVNVAPAKLRFLAALVFEVMDSFARALTDAASPYAETFTSYVVGARARLDAEPDEGFAG